MTRCDAHSHLAALSLDRPSELFNSRLQTLPDVWPFFSPSGKCKRVRISQPPSLCVEKRHLLIIRIILLHCHTATGAASISNKHSIVSCFKTNVNFCYNMLLVGLFCTWSGKERNIGGFWFIFEYCKHERSLRSKCSSGTRFTFKEIMNISNLRYSRELQTKRNSD